MTLQNFFESHRGDVRENVQQLSDEQLIMAALTELLGLVSLQRYPGSDAIRAELKRRVVYDDQDGDGTIPRA